MAQRTMRRARSCMSSPHGRSTSPDRRTAPRRSTQRWSGRGVNPIRCSLHGSLSRVNASPSSTPESIVPSIDSNHTRAAILILLLGVGLAIALTPFATGLIGIPVLYVILQPVHDRLARHVRPTPAAVIVVLLALFLVVVPGVSFVSLVVGQAQQVVAGGASNPLLAALAHLKIGDTDLGPQLASMTQDVAGWIGSRAFSLVGTAARLAINLLIALFGLYYAFLQPGETWKAVQPYIPFSVPNTDRLRDRFRNVTISTVIGTGATAALQGVMVGGAFWVAGLSNATFWGVVATVLAVLPVVGSGLVWAPGALALTLDHRGGDA